MISPKHSAQLTCMVSTWMRGLCLKSNFESSLKPPSSQMWAVSSLDSMYGVYYKADLTFTIGKCKNFFIASSVEILRGGPRTFVTSPIVWKPVRHIQASSLHTDT